MHTVRMCHLDCFANVGVDVPIEDTPNLVPCRTPTAALLPLRLAFGRCRELDQRFRHSMLPRDRDVHSLAMEAVPINDVLLFGAFTFDEDQELPLDGPGGNGPL